MSKAQILVVDDSVTICRVVRKSLQSIGYGVTVSCDGEDALKIVDDFVPDLVICDVNMPNMDGFAFCDELQKRGEPLSKLPIIFLTALESNALELLGIEKGGYLHKPFSHEDLVTMVWSVLHAHAQPI